MNKPKGLRRQVKDGDISAAEALHWLIFKEWRRPRFERWLRRKAQA